MIELHVCNKNGSMLRAFALGDADEILVGRDASCDVKIRAKSVSREHCVIERENGQFILRDLGSSGGTYCNGEKVDRVNIVDGTEVTVGPAVLKFYESEI